MVYIVLCFNIICCNRVFVLNMYDGEIKNKSKYMCDKIKEDRDPLLYVLFNKKEKERLYKKIINLAISQKKHEGIKSVLIRYPKLIYFADFNDFDTIIGLFCDNAIKVHPSSSLISSICYRFCRDNIVQYKLLNIFAEYVKINKPGVAFAFKYIQKDKGQYEKLKGNVVIINFNELLSVLNNYFVFEIKDILISYLYDQHFQEFSNIEKLSKLVEVFEKGPWLARFHIDKYLKDYISLMKIFGIANQR